MCPTYEVACGEFLLLRVWGGEGVFYRSMEGGLGWNETHEVHLLIHSQQDCVKNGVPTLKRPSATPVVWVQRLWVTSIRPQKKNSNGTYLFRYNYGVLQIDLKTTFLLVVIQAPTSVYVTVHCAFSWPCLEHTTPHNPIFFCFVAIFPTTPCDNVGSTFAQ